MAKTYEAMIKSKGAGAKRDLSTAASSLDTPSPDLLSDKQMVDLNYMIDQKAGRNNLKVINFVSSKSKEGTSTVLVNFMKFMLERNASNNILLVDANLQHPVLHLEFNVPSTPGLKDVLTDKAKLSDVTYKIESSDIYLIPNGNALSFETSNIESKMYESIFSKLSDRYQYIFIDSPPLLESSASLALATSADITFLVIQAHRTQWEVAQKAKNYLDHYNCPIGGVILNRVSQPIPNWIYNRL
jgi:capsular exopolysaccharide synthesis family protein